MKEIREVTHISAILLPQCAHATGIVIVGTDPVARKNYRAKISWEEITPQSTCGFGDGFTLMISEYEGKVLAGLMDDLWRMGCRPSGEFHGTAGQLAQAEKHLADLRTIAFHALHIP